MASAVGIPLVVLLGISPSGLNATSEGELQVWAQFIHAAQGSFFDAHLTTTPEHLSAAPVRRDRHRRSRMPGSRCASCPRRRSRPPRRRSPTSTPPMSTWACCRPTRSGSGCPAKLTARIRASISTARHRLHPCRKWTRWVAWAVAALEPLAALGGLLAALGGLLAALVGLQVLVVRPAPPTPTAARLAAAPGRFRAVRGDRHRRVAESARPQQRLARRGRRRHAGAG